MMTSDNIEKLRQLGESLIDPDFAIRLFEEGYPDAVVVVDNFGAIKLVNKHMELMFGYPRAELYDNKVEMLVADHIRPMHQKYRETFEEDPRTRAMGVGLVLQGRHKTGREFDVEISLSPIIATQGAYTVATIRKRRIHGSG